MFKNLFNITAFADEENISQLMVASGAADVWTAGGRGVDEDPLQKYRFRLKVPSYNVEAGFSKCSGIVDEIDVIEYCEGIWGYTHRIPGRTKVEPVTLERGAYSDYDGMYAINQTRKNPNMRSTMVIEIGRTQSESDNSVDIALEFTLMEAWVSKVEIGDLDATSGDILIEKMTVQYEYILFNNGDGSTDYSWD